MRQKHLCPTGAPPPVPPRAPSKAKSPDPRRFPFAAVCMGCGVMRALLKEMRLHLGQCLGGCEIDLVCGHYEFRTTSWPAMCAHLNRAGMQKEAACLPVFRMSAPLQLFPVPLPSLTPTTLRDVSTAGRRYQGQRGLSPEQLTSLRDEATRLRRGYRLTPCSQSRSRVSSRTKRSAALRSSLLERRSHVDVSRPPGEIDVVGKDVTAGGVRAVAPLRPS